MNKSPKLKKDKDSFIQEILSHVKSEIVSNDEQDEKDISSGSVKDTKRKNKTKKETSLNGHSDSLDVISLLVKQESAGLSKKRRKSISNVSDQEPFIKKIKTEPEDSDDLKQRVKKQSNVKKKFEKSKDFSGEISDNLCNVSTSSNSVNNKNEATKNKTSLKSKTNVSQNSSLEEQVILHNNIKQKKDDSYSKDKSRSKSAVSNKELTVKNGSIQKGNMTKSGVKINNSFTKDTITTPKLKLKKQQNIHDRQNSSAITNNNDESDSSEENILVPTPILIKPESRMTKQNYNKSCIDESETSKNFSKVGKKAVMEAGMNKQKTLKGGKHSEKITKKIVVATASKDESSDESDSMQQETHNNFGEDSESEDDIIEIPKPIYQLKDESDSKSESEELSEKQLIYKYEDNVVGQNKKSDNSSDESDYTRERVEVPKPKIKNENKANITRQKGKKSNSSTDPKSAAKEKEVPVPRPKLKKEQGTKIDKGKSDSSDESGSEAETLPKPKLKMEQADVLQNNSDDSSDDSDSTELPKSSSEGKEATTQPKPNSDSSEGSGSEAETLPKPKVKEEQTKMLQNTNPDDSSDDPDEAELPKSSFKGKSGVQNTKLQDSSDESVSEAATQPKPNSDSSEGSGSEAETLPKPKVKVEQSKMLQNTNPDDSSDDPDEIELPKSSSKEKSGVQNTKLQDSSDESDSEAETLPKRKKIKMEKTHLDAEKEYSDGLSDISDSGKVPKPILQIKGKGNVAVQNSKSDDSSDESESETEESHKTQELDTKQNNQTQATKLKNSANSISESLLVKGKNKQNTSATVKTLNNSNIRSKSKEIAKTSPQSQKKNNANILANIKTDNEMSFGDLDASNVDRNNSTFYTPDTNFKNSFSQQEFEEYGDESSEEETHLNTSHSLSRTPTRYNRTANTWQEKLMERNPNLVEIDNVTRVAESENEYFILRIPKNIDVSQLLKQKVNPLKETEVHVNNVQYKLEPKQSDPILANVSGDRFVNINRVLTLQRSIDVVPLKKAKVVKREDVQLPDNVKPRHPLFGITYRGKLKIRKDIQKKVIEAEENKNKQLQKKKKSKKADKSTSEHMMDIFNSEALFSTPKVPEIKSESNKKRKKKSKDLSQEISCSVKEEISFSSETNSLEDQPTKRKKKKRVKEEL
ncbi:uncharacterized protein LOC143199596 isoform X2 [Rhynchophorus ferrugineus]|uniref:uncharacterized protein LOC143199596 isoform X2 n=1 Tax=Rhynchophorus ferrugineus TaxID=354439 RepID=UPI003FCC6320